MLTKIYSYLFSPMSRTHIAFVGLFSRGRKIGTDPLGNVYYEAAPRPGYKRPRRWVIYKGRDDASTVPPQWHGWLHHQTDHLPTDPEAAVFRRSWQKPHRPNPTGTPDAYHPPGHVLAKGKRDKATGDYEAWSPDNDADKPRAPKKRKA